MLESMKAELVTVTGDSNEEIIKQFAKSINEAQEGDSIIIASHTFTHTTTMTGMPDIVQERVVLRGKDEEGLYFGVQPKSFIAQLGSHLKLKKELNRTYSFACNSCKISDDEAKKLNITINTKKLYYSSTGTQPDLPSVGISEFPNKDNGFTLKVHFKYLDLNDGSAFKTIENE